MALIPPSTVSEIIDTILQRSPDSTKPWRYVNRPYLGIGHGWLGTLAQILLSDPSPDRAMQVKPWIMDIIDQQLPDGDWNEFIDRPESAEYQTNDLIQIGHGAPGVFVGLLSIRGVYDKLGDTDMVERIDEAVADAQDVIWARGLLTKETDLQHGAAGNSLALLDRERKGTFLGYSVSGCTESGLADGSLDPSSSPSGSHRGLVGTVWAMCEYATGRDGVFPSFNKV